MTNLKATKDLSNDELATRILNALAARDLTHDEVIALGDSPHHAVVVLESLQMTGLVKAYCGSIQPSTCKYKLAVKCEEE